MSSSIFLSALPCWLIVRTRIFKNQRLHGEESVPLILNSPALSLHLLLISCETSLCLSNKVEPNNGFIYLNPLAIEFMASAAYLRVHMAEV